MNGILITGSSGLVGRALHRALHARGHTIRGLDLRAVGPDRGDIRDRTRVTKALEGVAGIVHLAAVSRVAWGERDPDNCWSTNVVGLRNLLECAQRRATPPWVIFASSREVYGQPDTLPVSEDAPLRPVNLYGRSKAAGEQLIDAARRRGVRASIVRLSNVYGCTRDHADRVVPAFARGSVLGSVLRVEGPDRAFDFTHVDETARGIAALVERLSHGADAPPPIQLVTGVPTTLGQLARLAIPLGGAGSTLEEAPQRSFDVSQFYGCSARARALLDWSPRISIDEGLARLIRDFRAELGMFHQQAGVS
jgi:nucleoside-diphosphate-sugar epimerase